MLIIVIIYNRLIIDYTFILVFEILNEFLLNVPGKVSEHIL